MACRGPLPPPPSRLLFALLLLAALPTNQALLGGTIAGLRPPRFQPPLRASCPLGPSAHSPCRPRALPQVLLGGTIGFFQSLCLLGYCLFPMDVAAIVCVTVDLMLVRLVVVVLAWCLCACLGTGAGCGGALRVLAWALELVFVKQAQSCSGAWPQPWSGSSPRSLQALVLSNVATPTLAHTLPHLPPTGAAGGSWFPS